MRRRKSQGRKRNAQRASVLAAAAVCLLSMVSIAMIYKNTVKKQEDAKSLIETDDAGEAELSEREDEDDRLSLHVTEQADSRLHQETPADNAEEVSALQSTRAETEAPETSEVPDAVESAAQVTADHFGENSILTWPVQGEVLMEYSMDSPVYFQTLAHYGYSEGMVIQAEQGMPVYASADGVVKSIAYTDEYGWTVTEDMGDGYEAVYGQLTAINVAEGDHIATGAIIAEVAAPSRNYSVEGDNVYFALKNNGTGVDPLNYLE